MPSTAALAGFAADVRYDRLPEAVRAATKRRVLDAVGVAIGSLGRPPTGAIRRTVSVRNATGRSRLWGSELGASPPDAALYNAALVGRGPGAVFLSPTPSPAGGTVAAVLAAAEARSATGRSVLSGLAAAHEIHGELAWHAPMDGFHPATHGAIAAAAGAARAMTLDESSIRAAIDAAAARATLPLVDADVLAVGTAARSGMNAALLAESGVETPDAFEGAGGWHARVGAFTLDLDPGCERVRDAAVRPFDAHPYAQPALGAAVTLAEEAPLDPATVDGVTVATDADAVPHVDPAAVAKALVDREVTTPPTGRADLEPIADTVDVRGDGPSGRDGRGEMPARVTVECRDGAVHETGRERFTGHPASPASWGRIEETFHGRVGARYDADRRAAVVETVRGLEAETAAELSRLLD